MSEHRAVASPVTVFYSYAHEDESLRWELEKHLSGLRWQGIITEWYDRNISAGTEWEREIDTHLDTADIILLLISPGFIASDYCYGTQMKRAMERHNAGEARIIPIILRPVDWERTLFSKLQVLPTNGKPVTKWPDRDDAFLDIVNSIRKVIEKLSPSSSGNPTGSSPIWNIPQRRNPYFTGREDVLKRLHDTLTTKKATALPQTQAIRGLGGIGKTQTAVEYAYRYRDEYRYVFWVRADPREELASDFTSIAGLLSLAERNAEDQSIIVTVVKHWLETHTGWLLILDNADEVEMVSDFLPTGGSGHVLLTTRTQAVGLIEGSIEVEKMDTEEGTLLLLRRAKILATDALLSQAREADRVVAETIVRTMDGLPLALDQAGAYIEETGCSLADYLDLYQNQRKKLLSRRSTLSSNYSKTVASTWSLSFQKVEQANPAAADLLRLCAFLSPDAIPEEIIVEGASELGSILESITADPFKWNEAMEALRRFSLIRRNPTMKMFSVHRLVQAVLIDNMNTDIQRLWAERAVRALNRVFPNGKFGTWQQCQRCLPHAQICAILIAQHGFAFPEAAQLLYHTGYYLRNRAQYTDAEPLVKRALVIREQELGTDHPDTAQSLCDLAELYRAQGRYEAAVPLQQRALVIREQELGPDHPDTAQSLNTLALLYRAQGLLEQAEPLMERALDIRKRVLGPDHPRTATILNNLAGLYRAYGTKEWLKQAEPLYQRALAIREQELGPDHPDTARGLNDLAGLYRAYDTDKGREQAEPLLQRALAIREQVLGPNHPDTAVSLAHLGGLYRTQRKYKEAEPLLQRALAIREQVLGPSHYDTTISLESLAKLYCAQGRYKEAEPLMKRIMTNRERELGIDHRDTIKTRKEYAKVREHNE